VLVRNPDPLRLASRSRQERVTVTAVSG
jgi:hypothetical protein